MHRTHDAAVRQSAPTFNFPCPWDNALANRQLTHQGYLIVKCVVALTGGGGVCFARNAALGAYCGMSAKTVANELHALTSGTGRNGAPVPVFLRKVVRDGRRYLVPALPHNGESAFPITGKHQIKREKRLQREAGDGVPGGPPAGETQPNDELPPTPVENPPGTPDMALLPETPSDYDERPRCAVEPVDRETANTLAKFSRERNWSNSRAPRVWEEAAAVLRRREEGAGNPDGTPVQLVAWYTANYARLVAAGVNTPKLRDMKQVAERWDWLVRLRNTHSAPEPRPESQPREAPARRDTPECRDFVARVAGFAWPPAFAAEVERAAAASWAENAALGERILLRAADARKSHRDPDSPAARRETEPLLRLAHTIIGTEHLTAWYRGIAEWASRTGASGGFAFKLRWSIANPKCTDAAFHELHRYGMSTTDIRRLLESLGMWCSG